MKYAEYQRQNLPIASGVVEAACKTLVTQRLKRSGMAWTPAGGQAILTLRSLIQSARWSQAWHLLAADFRQTITVVRPVPEQQRHGLHLFPHVAQPSHVSNTVDYHALPLAI